jgi:beta-carotene hydroxylase|tara:strand:+ start:137 stop:1048 length:912 start_codon:yes stop_codon:yes gene_type:complete
MNNQASSVGVVSSVGTTNQATTLQMTDVEILNKAIQYMGDIAWPTIITTLLAVTTYLAVLAGVILDYLPAIPSFLILSYLVYVVYTPLHEAVHNNISGRSQKMRWLNNGIGYIVASILGVSFTMHRSAHITHHRETNVEGKDPDLAYTDSSLFSLSIGGVLALLQEYQDYFGRVFPQAGMSEKITVFVELFVFVAWRVAIAMAGYPVEVLLYTLVANVSGVTLVGLIFGWLVHQPYGETARYKNTNTILLPAWIHRAATTLWLWQNYHSIHHLFPRVPFYQYEKLFNEIELGMSERGAPIIRL